MADCLAGDKLASHDAPGMINAYYVDGLPNTRGFTCSWHRWRKYPVIFFDKDEDLQTTLVHEIGHALGLTVAGRRPY